MPCRHSPLTKVVAKGRVVEILYDHRRGLSAAGITECLNNGAKISWVRDGVKVNYVTAILRELRAKGFVRFDRINYHHPGIWKIRHGGSDLKPQGGGRGGGGRG